MVRILHIVHAITRGGGLSNVVMNYYRNMNREKIQFDFLYFREVEDDFRSEIESLGGRCFYMAEPSLSLSFFKERESFFREHRGEWLAIHCHALFAVCIFAKVAKKYGVKSVIAHSHSAGYGIGKIIKKTRNIAFVSQARKLSDIHLACSHDAAEFMFGKNKIASGEVTIIKNAINCHDFIFSYEARIRIRNSLFINDETILIGHVGGFASQKNHVFLINIFSELQKRRPDSALLLVGGEGITAGSTKKIVLDKVRQCGLEKKVIFAGLRNDVNELLSAMDIFVFPSLFEGLGLSLVEAQVAGLQCFVSDVVPSEVKVTDNLTFLPLEAGVQEWALKLISGSSLNKKREVDLELFKEYDINLTPKKLYAIYQTIISN